jgi:predicted nucleotidyltransferase
MDEHKTSEKESVEENLSKDYIPKSKFGNLPVSNQVDKEIKKQMEKAQKEIESFREEITKKFKFIEAIGIVPAQLSKKIEEEYEVREEDSKKGLIHIIIIIPEKHFKNIGEIRLEAINITKKINEKLWIHVMTPIDYWNLGLDSKFEIMEGIAMSLPVLDKGILGAIRVSQIHKSLVLKKFEKYINCYAIYGSITRGETKSTSDIDIGIIIDDTDVKRMPRIELKEKLRGIIYSYLQEAEAIAGVKNKLSPQVWLLTEFWDGVKDAHPVFFTFIRDGIPLYDRGTFLPWKSLLKMGKIKPSPEAIDMFMSSGNKLKETIQRRIFDIATLDLFWGISTPTQGLLMLYGQAPPTPKETVNKFREIFYEKEKLVEKKYVDILEEILIKVWKAYEHGKLKPGDIDGKELDRLSKDAFDYIKRIHQLREQIEKRVQEKSAEEIYKNVFEMLGNVLKKNSEGAIVKEFNEQLIKKGKLPPKFLEHLKYISKIRKSASEMKSSKNKDMSKKQSKDIEQARRFESEIVNAMIEYTQRCDFLSLDRKRFLIKGKDMEAEIFFLKDTFIVQKGKIQKISNKKLVNSSPKELQEQISGYTDKETKIDFKSLETLKEIFGEFELVY